MSTSISPEHLPVAVIGAGPIGLAAALEPGGWLMPSPEGLPLGRELVAQYLEPLAAHAAIAPTLKLNTEVLAVSRHAHDKMKDADRANAPFVMRVRCPDGGQDEILARAVIDASGTWRTPNPLGASGVSALGESAASEHIAYGIPDVLGASRSRYAGKNVLVVGSGHSAFNVLLDLVRLAEVERDTTVSWVIRRATSGQLFGGEDSDVLPARGALGARVRQLVEHGAVDLVSMRIARVQATEAGVIVTGDDGSVLGPIDEIIATTGFRPDLELTREVRLGLDPALEAPSALAPLIDPNVHSCGTVPPHGAEELKHPEPNFFTVGMKSYGRAPTFLTLTGYEQVRSVVAALVGDWEAARSVELVLPETGVCSTDTGKGGGSCGASTSPVAAAVLVSEAELLVSANQPSEHLTPAFAGRVVSPAQVLPMIQSACCSPAAQTTCCEASAKDACCGGSGVTTSSTCGCQ
ncbi:MAG: NAD(P)-binding domain-containing protein [Chloroflexi bacterium]|nr:NAD(P)-binding domain-containing protein [Chloroflexota bacterium]